MTEAFKIETNIPAPTSSKRGWIASALRALAAAEIGASVYLPMKSNHVPSYNAQAGFNGGWYTSREEAEGRRIWKLAEPVKRNGAG